MKCDIWSREFWKYFLASVGTISSVVTLISFVYQWKNPGCCWVVGYILFVIVASLFFAWSQTKRKTSLNLKFSNTLRVKVDEGDLFSYTKDENFVVIPVNEYFDTIVDNKIINKGTIHGQFITRYYGENHTQLHEETEKYFATNNIKKKGIIEDREWSDGYKVRYPLGTCAIIKKDNTNFVLLAITHFDEEDHAFVELSEFGRAISEMCKTLADKVQNKPIYMPLMGMGMSRLNQSGQFILKYTLDTIVGIKDLALLGGVNIVVYPPIAKTLNLNEIKY